MFYIIYYGNAGVCVDKCVHIVLNVYINVNYGLDYCPCRFACAHTTNVMPTIEKNRGYCWTVWLTIVGLIGSILSLISSSDQLSKSAKSWIAIAGGIAGIVGNTISSFTGYMTNSETPPAVHN